MAKIIAVANQKGGVGKTTTTLNVGVAAAALGKKVLLVDFDPQGALTLTFGRDPLAFEHTIYDVLIEKSSITQVIVHTEGGPDLAPSNLNLAGAEIELLNELGRENFLKDIILI